MQYRPTLLFYFKVSCYFVTFNNVLDCLDVTGKPKIFYPLAMQEVLIFSKIDKNSVVLTFAQGDLHLILSTLGILFFSLVTSALSPEIIDIGLYCLSPASWA